MACKVAFPLNSDADFSALPCDDPRFGQRQPIRMPALSIRQPFASLIARGEKTLEIRNWETKYRGRLIIHSGLKVHRGQFLVPERGQLFVDDCRQFVKQFRREYPLGCLVGIANLIGCRPFLPEDEEKARVRYAPGLTAWEFADAVECPDTPAPGQLRLFYIDVGELPFFYNQLSGHEKKQSTNP